MGMDGGSASFEETFRREYPSIVRTTASIIGSVEDAEAVTQDAFVKAFARWTKVGGYDAPGAWIQRVAIRDAVRVARRQARRPPDHRTASPAADGASIDLERAIRALPPKQRACIVLHYLCDEPVARVAELVGCKESTVKVHLHKARHALAAALRDDEELVR